MCGPPPSGGRIRWRDGKAAVDEAARERLSRYCAEPPFALDRLRDLDPEHLLYESTKLGPGGNGPLLLTPLHVLDRLAALVPPPRVLRHRYHSAPAPNLLSEVIAVTVLQPRSSRLRHR